MHATAIQALKGDRDQPARSPEVVDDEASSVAPDRPWICCAECGAPVADERDVFHMAADGPVAAFVNPGGFVHEIVTVRAVQEVRLLGPAVSEDSWFPGYTWTIGCCGGCGAHLGWRFDALAAQSPPVFWGLRRAALVGF
jgi:cereblon